MSERILTRFPVRLRLAAGEVDATTRNISLRGMFILTDVLVPVDTVFSATLRLPALDEDSHLEVTVRFTRPDGFGVGFGTLRPLDVWALHQLLRQDM